MAQMWGAAGRENTEGEYSGLEHEVVEDVVESIKACPSAASEPGLRYRGWGSGLFSEQDTKMLRNGSKSLLSKRRTVVAGHLSGSGAGAAAL